MITIISIILICITILASIGYITYISNKNIKRKYDQKQFELELEKYKFFSNIDLAKVKEELDNLINRYFSYYVLYNFEAHQKHYIKKDEIDKGVKDITKNIVIEMSELYTFYFKLLYNIDTEEQLTSKVLEMVTDTMIAYVADFNKPREDEGRA